MNVASTAERIKERRLDRMRLGQAVCDYVSILSDPEIRLCIVPLTEAQYLQVLEKVAAMTTPDDLAGMSLRDRVQSQEILVRAIREEDDLTKRVWTTVEAMMEELEITDVDELVDRYNEMVEKASPAIDSIPPEEIDALKKLLQEMDWSELSGRAWYAAKRFLSTVMPSPLLDNSPGSASTSLLTTTND